MEKWLITNVPTALLGLGIAVVTVGLALGGLLIVRRQREHEDVVPQHEVAGFLIAVVGVIYAVVLAFVVVISWEQYTAAATDAASEAGAIGSLYRDAVALGPQGRQLRRAVSQYAHQVAYVEWPYVAKHLEEDPGTSRELNTVWKAVTQLKTTATQAELARRAVDDITQANVNRRERIDQSGSQLPTPLWIVVLAGGVLTIGFCYFFSLENVRAQAAMISILAALIALSVFVILALDLPFSGDVAVQPAALHDEINEFCSYNFINPRLPGNCDAISRARTASTGPRRVALRSTSTASVATVDLRSAPASA
jgi:hypothetical protein